MSFNYLDIHCDTASKMYYESKGLFNNGYSVSLEKLDVSRKNAFVFAICSENIKTEDANYDDFLKTAAHLKKEIKKHASAAVICTSGVELMKNDGKCKIILSAESARPIGGDLDRLRTLYKEGVRILNPAWEGKNRVCGAYNTNSGFSSFGKEVIAECERLGIIIDASHLSDKAFYELASISKRPFFASHSNSRSVCNHRRNLTDKQFRIITERKGIVGLSLVAKHLKKNTNIKKDTVLFALYKHLTHFTKLNQAVPLALGLDFDGTVPTLGLSDISCINDIYGYLIRMGINEALAENIFYNNAFTFLSNLL